MDDGVIRIVNARQHNLQGITVDLPRRALVVVTGPSGSGKSSLAFDTLYAEGQRRYVESLSTYAKQFLDRMPKPLVDRLDGIAPAVAIEQRNPTVSSRSTVGTATEVYDYLRLLWARVGTPYCRNCGALVRRDTPGSAAEAVVAAGGGRVQVGFPLPGGGTGGTGGTGRTGRTGETGQRHELIVEFLTALGFVRVVADGMPMHVEELPAGTDLAKAGEVLVVVDRLVLDGQGRAGTGGDGRLVEAIQTAFGEGEGICVVLLEDGRRLRFTEFPACSACDTPTLPSTPSLFSFNNPRGACQGCNGFGAVLEYDESLVVPDPDRSLREGAIDPWTKPRYEARRRLLLKAADQLGADPDVPWRSLKAAHRRELLHGKVGRYVGIFRFLKGLEEKRYKQYVRVFLRQYQLAKTCPACGGARLNPHALAVRVGDATIAHAASLTIAELAAWLEALELPEAHRRVAELVLAESRDRLAFLLDVGLGYLSLDRQTRTLSGGEAQRIALSNALGARLVDSLYVLDEPSIGLHPRDTDRLLAVLRRLRDYGNTVVVVEHDPATIAAADWMLELGPGAGEHGGRVVHEGPPDGSGSSLTAKYLRGERRIAVPSLRRVAGPRWLRVRGAKMHNLDGVDADIPLGTLVAVTGVSGSGKSTLVQDVLYRQLEARLHGGHSAKTHLGEEVGEVDALEGWERLTDVVLVDQSPIGRSPRSNPITYVKGFDEIRELFAGQPLARGRGYTASTFSFNLPGGRCDGCEGAGHVQVEMVFLADVFVPCEVCEGTRFKAEVLEVKIQGRSIHDVLQWTVEEAAQRFKHQAKLGGALHQLRQVGLGYLRLGQPATTLSGGEAQRLKIARELIQAGRNRTGRDGQGRAGTGSGKLYILDEPTTGLHLEDVRVLLQVLDRLVEAGHTVLVIEHHLDLIKRADWVIDLGPEAGAAGGRVVAQGPPEEVARNAESHTGRYLVPLLAEHSHQLSAISYQLTANS